MVYKYDGLGRDEAEVVVAAGWYAVTERHEDGKPKTVDLKDVPPGQLDAFGLTADAKKLAWSEISDQYEEETKDEADVGGILLAPLFGLVNFIADSITEILGNIMMPNEATGSILRKTGIPVSSEVKDYIDVSTNSFLGGYKYPHIKYTPEEIFAGKIDLLSIDFISGKNYEGNANTNKDWINIRKVISQWYQVLRMIAIIGLLSVLIYTGIKIIVSANAKDKAKYKEWIINWFMAAAILFSMHIIMAFIISVTGEFSKLISEASQSINVRTLDGKDPFATNLMGLVRFRIQSENFVQKVGYEIMYIALLVYTIKFTFIYLKRVLNMAFLTLIAPIVALTYPIDKINDGRAQGFDMWIKEYIFNALLQPMHLVLYYVLVGSAVTIAASNPIYGIVVLMFMTEAEKLLKKIFGFDKAGGGTVGGMAGAFAAGAIASNIKNIANLAGKNGGKGGNKVAGAEGTSALPDPKPLKDDPVEDGFINNLSGDDNDSPVQGSQRDNMTESEVPSEETQTGRQPIGEEATSELPNGELPSGEVLAGEPQGEGQPTGEVPTAEEPNTEMPNSNQPSENASNPQPTVDNGDPIEEKAAKKQAIKNGFKSVGKYMAKPIYDFSRDKKYNKQRWKRRGINALKTVGKAAVGAGLGITAAAVQAGISITDGKYNPIEGIATFSAGFAGGKALAGNVGSKISGAFKEGYYDGNDEALRKKMKEEFMYNAETEKAYKQKYGANSEEMKQLAADHMLPYGYKDTKEQFAIQKFAQHIQDHSNGVEMKDAIKQSRSTLGFIGNLEKQGQKGIIGDPKKQEAYIDSMIKAKNATGDEATKMRKSYENAFKSAAQWYQVNR